MKTEVYSWRVSGELKSKLEREARLHQASVSAVLEQAVRSWLNRPVDLQDNQEQQQLHQSASESFGTITGKDSSRSGNARKLIRNRLRQQNAR